MNLFLDYSLFGDLKSLAILIATSLVLFFALYYVFGKSVFYKEVKISNATKKEKKVLLDEKPIGGVRKFIYRTLLSLLTTFMFVSLFL